MFCVVEVIKHVAKPVQRIDILAAQLHRGLPQVLDFIDLEIEFAERLKEILLGVVMFGMWYEKGDSAILVFDIGNVDIGLEQRFEDSLFIVTAKDSTPRWSNMGLRCPAYPSCTWSW